VVEGLKGFKFLNHQNQNGLIINELFSMYPKDSGRCFSGKFLAVLAKSLNLSATPFPNVAKSLQASCIRHFF